MKCVECKHKYPKHLIQPMVIGVRGKLEYRSVCPFCALKITNLVHGLSRTDFFPGSAAQSMLEEARKHLKSN